MYCYNCGCFLSEHDFCTGCGADVSRYKKIMHISNRYYNDGLEKAGVRDLTGAIDSLRQSLKFNKNNIDARNLLGLVYFESGEVVAALSEWVISKNLRPKKNIADDYIDMIQTNQTRLDAINQTIKKYNQALAYCYQNSLDLAMIQLKKVLSYNPKFIRAHQLLALLYIESEEWEAAKSELVKCQQIDTANITTMRYLSEVEHMLVPEEPSKTLIPKKKNSEDIIRYQSGNETIIQPREIKETKGVSSLLNLGIGVVIGIAIACFLILPARIQTEKAGVSDELRTVSEQSDAKTATIDELNQKVDKLTEENKSLTDSLSSYEGTDGSMKATDNLLLALNAYMTDPTDIDTIAGFMDLLDTEALQEETTEAFKTAYDSLIGLIGQQLADKHYTEGYAFYRSEDYTSAIPSLERAFQYDQENVDALFYLANSYRSSSDVDKAKELYAKVIELFPDSDRATKAETYLAEINNDASGE